MLHEGELAADEDLVRGLLAAQAPAQADLPLRRLVTTGTVHHVFRLGDDLLVRLPRLARLADGLAREAAVVPLVERVLPVAVPRPVLLGVPTDRWPLPWSVVRWIDGAVPAPSGVPVEALAAVVEALRTLDPLGLPDAGRPTAEEADPAVQDAIARLTGFDRGAVARAWEDALAATPWDGRRTPIHADLLPPNLLVEGGALVGVLDWESAGAGDPANDLVPAWSCFRGPDRGRFRHLVGADDAAWERARGIALAQAVVAIPYYDATSPDFAALNRATLAELLADG